MRLPWAKKRPKTAVMPAAPQALTPGEIVGGYRIERQLGEGGMGAVYRATHTLMGTPAVVKVLLPQFSAHPEISKRFINEATAASNLRHRNIVAVHECGIRPNGQCYIGMELLDGLSLADFIDTHRPLGLPTVVQIAIQIANGLHAAHESKIIHRDMKPENVFVTAVPGNKHKVTILDFGCAKFEEPANGVRTNTAAALGTPLYMPPEQFKSPKTIDRRADVYALSAVTWEMIVGRRLWGDCETIGQIISTQLDDTQRLNPCAFVPGLPAAIGAGVARGLAPDPRNRWKSAQAFGLALAATLNDTEWGSDAGIELVTRYAIELNITTDSDAATEGVRMPAELVRAAAPPMRAIVDGAAPLPAAAATTPAPAQAARDAATMPERPAARALTPATAPDRQPGEVPIVVPVDPQVSALRVSTLGAAAGQSEARIASSPPVSSSRRTGVLVAGGALVAVAVGAAIVGLTSGGGSDRPAATDPIGAPTAPASSALAVITDPPGAVVVIDGVSRGPAPVNVGAPVGTTIEVRASLAGHVDAIERVTIGADPATVRLTLAPHIDAGPPVDASAVVDAAPPIDAATRRRDRKPPTSGQDFDPDGVLR